MRKRKMLTSSKIGGTCIAGYLGLGSLLVMSVGRNTCFRGLRHSNAEKPRLKRGNISRPLKKNPCGVSLKCSRGSSHTRMVLGNHNISFMARTDSPTHGIICWLYVKSKLTDELDSRKPKLRRAIKQLTQRIIAKRTFLIIEKIGNNVISQLVS